MQGIAWAGIEVKLFVPPSGRLVLCMHDQGSNAGDVGCAGGTQENVFQQRPAKARSLPRLIDREAAKYHHWYRVSGQSLADPWRRFIPGYATNRQGVITANMLAPARYIGL